MLLYGYAILIYTFYWAMRRLYRKTGGAACVEWGHLSMGVRTRLGAGPCPHLATWANLTVEMRGQKATIYLGERLVTQMVSRPRARGRVGLLAAARKGSILVFRSPSLGHRPNSVGTSHGYVTRLRHTATSHGYVTRLRHTATSHGYVTRLRHAATSRDYVAWLCHK